MFRIVRERLHQKHQTIRYPKEEPRLPDRFLGLPGVRDVPCSEGCAECRAVCPTQAVAQGVVDLSRCIFCGECARVCPAEKIEFSRDFRLAWVDEVRAEVQRLFGRSLKLRQVSAGGCNACEADCNVLTTLSFDLGRFGIQFVASPRHADGILVTGPVTKNMELALRKTYAAVPEPKVVIAVGACALSGGVFAGHSEIVEGGLQSLMPVDMWIPGCPPHPLTILEGLLRIQGRVSVSDVRLS